MDITNKSQEVIFEENVKTTNDNRIRLIENTINFFEEKKIPVNIDHYEFYLILDEAISNAMEHGNRWIVEKKVSLKVFEQENHKIEICISDEGPGFNPGGIPQKINGANTLSPRGRGIIIIKKFCDVLWNKTGNEISLFLKVA